MRLEPAGTIIPAPADFAGVVTVVVIRGERIRIAGIDMALAVLKAVVALVEAIDVDGNLPRLMLTETVTRESQVSCFPLSNHVE